MVLGVVSTSLSAISAWIWVPTYLYAYYLGIVLPLWYIASRTFNDDPSVGGAPSSSSSSSKTSKTSQPSWPILQVSIRSFITITLLLVLSSVFYFPLYYMQKLEGDHVLALFFLGAIASFMNARMIQLIVFTPISTRRSWSIVRLFCECTSIIETLEPNSVVGGKRKAKKVVVEDDAEEEEEDSQAKTKREQLRPLRTWSEVVGFSIVFLAKAFLKFGFMLFILYKFHDNESSYEQDVPTSMEVVGAVPTVLFGFPQPFGHPVISHWEFLYFFIYHAAHGFAFYLLMSSFSDFGVSVDSLLVGPNDTARVVDIWNYPFLATSPRDFWGRRWNLLFRTIFHQLLFVPIAIGIDPILELLQLQTISKKKKRIPTHLVKKTALLNANRASPEGRLVAATVVFLFSGLLHEWINYIAFGERSMENVAFFLLHAAACAVQTQAIQTSNDWKMNSFSSFWQRALCWVAHTLFLALTSPLFFGPYHRAQFFPRLLSLFGLRH